MEKKTGKIALGVAVLGVLLGAISIGIVYAAFNQDLSIDGTADVGGSSWKIKFENLSTVALVGDKAEEITAPTINTNDTNIGDYDVKFVTPGSSATYTFDVTNDGTFDAVITNVVVPTPTCTGNGTNATTDAENVCKHLSYTLTYADNTPVVVGDSLAASETKNLKLVLTYKDTITSTELPTDDVAIDNLGITILYTQD